MLVAIDGSPSGMHALHESFKLAVKEKSWITVVSVVPPYVGDLDLVGIGNVQHALRQPCEKALADAAALAAAEGALVKTVCEEGEPHERITDLADAEDVELIIMGRRGMDHIDRALVGSVTARVIGHSQRDVLVVPQNTAVGWDRILVATDGSRFSEAATSRAIDFAQAYGGSLLAVSIVDVPAEFYGDAPDAVEDLIAKAKTYAESVEKLACRVGVKSEVFVREGKAFETIINLARDQRASAIVLGSHGRTGLRRLLMGSVTERVIGHAPCPVLVART
jgi:nucleotide-binding universal stress UspA family protein